MNDEVNLEEVLIKNELQSALANVEDVRQRMIKLLDKLYEEDDEVDEKQQHLLINYKLELLDMELRLNDLLEHLHLIEFD